MFRPDGKNATPVSCGVIELYVRPVTDWQPEAAQGVLDVGKIFGVRTVHFEGEVFALFVFGGELRFCSGDVTI